MGKKRNGNRPGEVWRRGLGICMALALVLPLTGCGDAGMRAKDLMEESDRRSTKEDTEQEPDQDTEKAESPVEDFFYAGKAESAFSDFGLKLLYNNLEDKENVLVSPLSVLSALAMTANGAEGGTLSQIEQTFGISLDELNPYLRDLREGLPEGEKYRLDMANAIWFRDADFFQVEQTFLDINREYYGAGLFQAPFDDTTVQEINSWVKDHTNGMVKDILDKIPDEEVMYLVNALAFDGEWQEIYKDFQVREENFTLEDGTVKKVDMMWSEESVYLSDDQAEGFLKYYVDGKYAFAALLPEEGLTVEEYVASLTGEKLCDILACGQDTQVWARIPKFESEYGVELGETLRQMGMEDAFDRERADFSGIGHSDRGNLYISRVIHKTYIAMNERGTRAGAATVVAPADGGAAMEIKEVYLDRPFFYMIVDCEQGMPVFMGVLMEP